VNGVACPNDPRHQLSLIRSEGDATGRHLFGETSAGERISVVFTCSACSAVQGTPVHFGRGPEGALVEVLVPPESAVDLGDVKRFRRLPRTIAVGVVGLAIIFYVATGYSWFNSSIWGGVAFFVLLAALAIAYRADDNAAHRQGAQERPTM